MNARAGRSRWSRRARRRAGWIAAIVLVAAAAASAGAFKLDWFSRPPTQAAYTVAIGDDVFVVEVAADDRIRYRGLSGRRELPADRGMLFVYAVPRPARDMQFVMRDCWIDLDVAFISADRRIAATHTMTVEPPGTPRESLKRYGPEPGTPTQFVLELAGGELARRDIAVGDEVTFSDAVTRAIAQAR